MKNNLKDRNRTINDYYRMNLDQSIGNQKSWEIFSAYLQNTPGSKKALKEIMRKAQLAESLTTQ